MISSVGYNLHMDKIKPYQRIASQFQISNESAKYFLGRVQKSFKKQKPPHALILEFMDVQGIGHLPEPYDLAALMNESGVWDHALNAPPPILVDGEEV
jgi:hypothetical protein